jgi:hypothetical protein
VIASGRRAVIASGRRAVIASGRRAVIASGRRAVTASGRRAVLVLVLAVLVGACGVRSDPEPRQLAVERVPYGLLDDAAAATTIPSTPSVPKAAVNVYFVRADRMVAVVRQVNAPLSVTKSLLALLFGVQGDEAAAGIRSAIDPTAEIQTRSLDGGIYVVDLSPEFAQGTTNEQILGLAQIVYTATELPGVTGIRFTLNGVPIEAPTPSGTTADPVGRDVFADFDPVPPNTPNR